MRQTVFALIIGSFMGSFAALSLPAADQQLVNMVMPDAKIVAGINVDSVRNSPLGTFLLSQMAASDADFQKFVQATGFNPRTDLSEILVATSAAKTFAGPAVGVERGLILARGKFNVEKFSELAKTDGKQQVETYNGATLVWDAKNANASAAAFIGNEIVIAGDLASVKAAVDRRTLANSLDTQLTTKVNALSASEDAWAVSIVPLSSLNTGAATDPSLQGALNGDLFKKITTTSGGIKFGAQVQLSTQMVAMDEKNASALGDVMKFLAGMVSMNAGSQGAPPAMAAVLQSMTVETEGNVVNVTLSAPEDLIEGQIKGMMNSVKPSVKTLGATI